MELAQGRYRLDEELGSGGAATVYRAWDTALGVPRAVKLLHAEPSDEELSERSRMLAEARAMAKLDHANVLRVYDIGQEDDRDFVVMDLAEGGSLGDLLAENGPLSPALTLKYAIQILAALAAAHAAGIVHRDVKPSNVLLDATGSAKLADFGIALVADDVRNTRTGMAMGSLAFMAPEQRLNARGVGPQADIYAVGATMYALLTARNPVDLFAARKPDHKRWKGLDEPLVALLRKATMYSPDQRYTDARAMAADVLAMLYEAGEQPLRAPAPDDEAYFPLPSRRISTIERPETPAGPAPLAVDASVESLAQMGVTASNLAALTLASDGETPAPVVRPQTEDDDSSPVLRWALLILLSVTTLIASNWWIGAFDAPAEAPPDAHPTAAPEPPTRATPAPEQEPTVEAPEPASAPEPEPEPAVEVPKPRPAPSVPTSSATPPLGAWSGSLNGQEARLELSGSLEAPTGRFIVSLMGNEVVSEVSGSWNPDSRSLLLRDTQPFDDAGSYSATLDPDLGRMQGTFQMNNGGRVVPFVLTRQ